MKQSLSEIIVKYIEVLGVEYVFGIPGSAINPLFDALSRSNTIKVIVARHETGAAFMAEGYARESGKLGVCCSTSGPGATNLLTGVANAFTDKVPMLVLTAQNSLSTMGKKSFQDSSPNGINTTEIFRNCSVYSDIIKSSEQLEPKLNHAIYSSFGIGSMHKGPSHLSLPKDLLESEIYTVNLDRVKNTISNITRLASVQVIAQQLEIDYVFQKLLNSKKSIFILGEYNGTCQYSCNDKDCLLNNLFRIAEYFGIPVLCTPEGKQCINTFHQNFKGVFGFAGHSLARKIMEEPDTEVIAAFGLSFNEMSTNSFSKYLLNDKLIHIDDQISNFRYSYMADKQIFSDIGFFLQNILDKILSNKIKPKNFDYNHTTLHRKEYLIPANKDALVKPQQVIESLSRLIPKGVKIFADTGNSWAWAIHYLEGNFRKNINITMSFGSMCWAIGSAIGCAFANPKTMVCCITGDGSYLMGGQEVSVALEYNLPILFIILNDGHLGMVKHGQKLTRKADIANKLPKVDFSKMVQAFGMKSMKIENQLQFYEININSYIGLDGPFLLDVNVDPEEIPFLLDVDTQIKPNSDKW